MLVWSWRLNRIELMTFFIWKILATLMSYVSLFTKFKVHTFVGNCFFGEITIVDLKSIVSLIPNTKLYHWWNGPLWSSSTGLSRKKRPNSFRNFLLQVSNIFRIFLFSEKHLYFYWLFYPSKSFKNLLKKI